jgi:hypothetical protein
VIFKISLGSILRFANTVAASWAFAMGDYGIGTMFVIGFLVTLWLENRETPESP